MRNKKILLYIIGLQLLDILTTYLAISCGAKELNPLVYYLLDKLAILLVVKSLIGLIVYYARDEIIVIIYSVIMLQAIVLNTCNIITRLIENL